jgi:hypothetical protein
MRGATAMIFLSSFWTERGGSSSAVNVARRQPNLIWSDVRQKTK